MSKTKSKQKAQPKKKLRQPKNAKKDAPKADRPFRSAMDDKGLYFCPLGGSEQFGVNLNLYACDGQYLAIDCGLGFADERFPGIDLLLPDPWLLEARADELKGMIITHAHEDHIGAVAHLWERFECPLYCTEFTAAVLHKKLRERNIKHAKVHILEHMIETKIGRFAVKPVSVSHSIPDTCSLLIHTKYGQFCHSGDWNLDPAPVVGSATKAAPFKQAAKEGVIAYIGDSTNAGSKGRSGSEGDVEEGLYQEFIKCKGKIAVTIFSSNIGRVISVARAAKRCGRDVGVIGRSLHRMIGCAKECGYIDDIDDFLSEEDMGYVPDDKIVMIMTGSQGEHRAALSKVSRGEHRSVSLSRGDSVIFSARTIPGNEREINAVKNNLIAGGVRVVSPRESEYTIHVSGHPCRDEIIEMFGWLKPDCVIPVHGERAQLEDHAALAAECQINSTVVPNNGSIIRLAPDQPELVDHVETGLLAVDQKRLISADHRSITQRRKLQFSGVIHVSLVMDARGELIADPKLDTAGLVDIEAGDQAIEDKIFDEILDLLDDMSWEELTDDHFVSEEVRIGLRRLCFHMLGLKPATSVHVIRV